MVKKTVLLTMCVVTAVTCDNAIEPNYAIPVWLDLKITDFKAEPVTNPPHTVIKYKYNNVAVYHVPAVCCDQYGILYSENGDTLCLPDGGFDGKGDGRCSDFFQTATESSFIWKDNRN